MRSPRAPSRAFGLGLTVVATQRSESVFPQEEICLPDSTDAVGKCCSRRWASESLRYAFDMPGELCRLTSRSRQETRSGVTSLRAVSINCSDPVADALRLLGRPAPGLCGYVSGTNSTTLTHGASNRFNFAPNVSMAVRAPPGQHAPILASDRPPIGFRGIHIDDYGHFVQDLGEALAEPFHRRVLLAVAEQGSPIDDERPRGAIHGAFLTGDDLRHPSPRCRSRITPRAT